MLRLGLLTRTRGFTLPPRLSLLSGQSFSFGLTLALLIIPASAIFLSTFGSARLPYTYIATALLGFLSASSLATLQQRWSIARLAMASSVTVAALAGGSWLALRLADARWVSFILLVLFALYLQIGFVFLGGQAGRLFEVREIKRLFPRIVSGFAIGFLVGGAIAVPLVELLGRAENLLLTTTASALLLLLFQALTSRRFRAELDQVEQGGSMPPRLPLRQLLARRYVALIFLYQLLSAAASQLLDFMLFDQAARRYQQSESLAQFVGNFTWVVNLVDILFLALVAGYLLNRFGLRFGLAANPADVGILLIAMLVTGLWLGTLSLPFFLLVIAARISDIALTDGATRTSLNATYQAIPLSERFAVQTGVEGIAGPLALGLTGGILLLFNAIPGMSTLHLVLLALGVAAGWFGAAILVYRDYGANLMRVLKRRALNPAELTISDGSTLAVVERLVHSDEQRDVRVGLDMLEAAEHPSLPGHLQALIQHAPPKIRVEALARVERLRLIDLRPSVEAAVGGEAAHRWRGLALRALAALDGEGAVAHLRPYLEQGEQALRLGAIVGLLRYGGPEGERVVAPVLRELVGSPDATERRLAAQLLGEAGVGGAMLLPLLQDEALPVRRAALLAADPARYPVTLDAVVAALEEGALRSAALHALSHAGVDVAPLLENALRNGDHRKIESLLLAGSLVRQPPALAVLADHLDHPDHHLRGALLAALAAADYQAPGAQRAQIEQAIRQEVHLVQQSLAARDDLGEGEEAALAPLRRALTDQIEAGRARLFCYLSFLYDSRAMQRAASHLREGRREVQALAVELLDVSLAPGLREVVLPLVEPGRSPTQRLEALAARHPVTRLPREARLAELRETRDGAWGPTWTRACARYASQRLGLIQPVEGDSMLLTVEKVAILNRVESFAGTPDYLLAAVAEIVEEVEVAPGETFIEEGTEEACMYVVVEGEVRVHRNDRTIITLGPGDTVGELAVLDPEPRSASVTALGGALLFRIDREPFEEVMAARPEIARGVIRALAQRIRTQGQLATPG